MDAPVLFAAVAAFAIVTYVLVDGFDLGVGIIFLAAPRESDRDLMMQSIEPVWDSNETWLVMGGTLLFAAFPPAYYILLPAFYLPIMLMLLALVARGVAFSFRVQGTRRQPAWDLAFAAGSVLATLAQGMVLGGLVGGVPIANGIFAGGPFDWLNPLGLLCGLGLLGGYALMGATWLIWKTDGSTQVFAREIAHAALLVTMAGMLAVSGWSVLTQPELTSRWFAWPNIALLAPVPFLTAVTGLLLWRSLWGARDRDPFLLSVLLFLLGFVGIVVSFWPYIVPRSLTIWDGASDPQTQLFIGVGLAIVLPVVLLYQAHAYWVFRGKTRLGTDG